MMIYLQVATVLHCLAVNAGNLQGEMRLLIDTKILKNYAPRETEQIYNLHYPLVYS